MKQICCWKNYWLTFSNLLLISPHPLRKKKLSSYDLHKYTTAFLTWQFPFWVFKIFFRFVRSFSLKLKFWALQNDLFDSKICILEISIWNVVVFNMAFNFACFVYLLKLGKTFCQQNLSKKQEWSLRLKKFQDKWWNFGAVNCFHSVLCVYAYVHSPWRHHKGKSLHTEVRIYKCPNIRSTNWNGFLLDQLGETETLHTVNFTEICQKYLLYSKWTKWKTISCETRTKMETFSRMDHSVISTLICTKVLLHTKWATVKSILETSPF